MKLTDAPFKPPAWLTNCNAQTIFPSSVFCRAPLPGYKRERIVLLDGDFIDVDWLCSDTGKDQPLLILLHGLEGSSQSSYARLTCDAAQRSGLDSVVMHFRGCSGTPNHLPRRYHAGETGDLEYLIQLLEQRFPNRKLCAIGFSLGGNVLLKYLGQNGTNARLSAAVSVCPPYDLSASAEALAQPRARFYQWFLLRNMRRALVEKYSAALAPFDWQRAIGAQNFYEFDDTVTAPLHGFNGADDYYSYASCGQYVEGIRTPTLLLGAFDDPFMFPETFPKAENLPADVEEAFSQHGGHVGFVYGAHPLAARYWIPERAVAYFVSTLGIKQNAHDPEANRA